MNILVLGASGFIGSAVIARLLADGHRVSGLARNPNNVRNRNQHVNWLKGDLNLLSQALDWTQLLAGHDIVVNCAGALQDGLRDDLQATQSRAMIALYEACRAAEIRLVIQISANTSGAGAETAFLATKRAADEALATSGLNHVILRPALVIGRNAHGGTALLRALAALPGIIPLAYADSRVATVALEDVAHCVADAVSGAIPSGSDLELAADKTCSLAELVEVHRTWLGLPGAPIIPIPAFIAGITSRLADMAGYLGWRSPLRSTAMKVMAGGVVAGAGTGPTRALESVGQTLARNPSGVQDLWSARLYLLKPVLILTLASFWLASGIIPLFDVDRAAAFLAPFTGWTSAVWLTLFTCAADCALGLAVLFRPLSKLALMGMFCVSLIYVVAGSLLTPGLWLDPLGPFVKVLPSMALTLVALATLEER